MASVLSTEPDCSEIVLASSPKTLSAFDSASTETSSRVGENEPIEMQVEPGFNKDLITGSEELVQIKIKSHAFTASISVLISISNPRSTVLALFEIPIILSGLKMLLAAWICAMP